MGQSSNLYERECKKRKLPYKIEGDTDIPGWRAVSETNNVSVAIPSSDRSYVEVTVRSDNLAGLEGEGLDTAIGKFLDTTHGTMKCSGYKHSKTTQSITEEKRFVNAVYEKKFQTPDDVVAMLVQLS